ncbi:GNAT family N-acetyltransferase [Deinococcus fonticola]|uniref:GNAT family N-acetyltransferase n=1 Tax=Deinococcus fonticola TaxID=2528713 RepID=UPI0010754F87|nr:GNAT family N-acetyltransferase [Deinococcus fonticola]
MIELVPFSAPHRAALLNLRLAPGQESWTHLPAELLPEIEGHPARQAATVLENGIPLGMFVLSADERVEWYAGQPDPQALTLNGLSLDRGAQGRGLGTQVMDALPEYVARTFPYARRLLLCVHQTNLAALHVYRKTGWTVLRERQGKRGLLWVMEKKL